ncbi:IPTL-CTERM sorting domain-containing protein [Diaphorobacter caeni]|uniref:IPTL-CTERM sorting domain-containing protein n=1 Tax=Diaphorobacter caeni TaxID=2784387 RepID=UPI0018903A7D|nr:IPTL-CTERM sorting domain-containing protein [Diaphorobacter caeni]MBF5005110.1 IPTL-CTERM sorting domain-containing protein [Diaphorobacter caeni]
MSGVLLSGTAGAATIPDVLVNHDGLAAGEMEVSGPAGGSFTYRAKVRLNAGPTASNITLTEVLPEGAIFQSTDSKPSGISCTPTLAKGTVLDASNNKIKCTISSLAEKDGFKWVDFNVILPTVGTNWEAIASASLPKVGEIDGDGGINNVDLRRNFTTSNASDLGVKLQATGTTNGEVNNGDPFGYQIDVTNHGPTEIPGGGMVRVTFEVPAGAPVTGTPTGDGWSCQPGGMQTSGVITCNYKVPAGETVTVGKALNAITVPVKANMGGPIGAAVSVEAFTNDTATTPVADGQKDNNTDSVIVTSAGADFADMSLAKAVSASKVDATTGTVTPLVYTLTAKRESGSLTPSDIVVLDVLPKDVEFVSFDTANNAGWSCTYAGAATRTVRCEWAGEFTGGLGATMPPIKFNAQVTAPADALLVGSRVNTATLSMPPEVPEPNTTNNKASAAITFNNTAQLALTKGLVGDGRPVEKGKVFQYQLTVKNDGPMPVLPGQSIELKDTPSSEIRLLDYSDKSAWSCADVNGVAGTPANCSTTAGLKVGESITLIFDAQVDTLPNGAEYANWNNAASAGVNPGDRGGETISANANVTISDRRADLLIEKTLVSPNPGPAVSGDLVTYHLKITNDANSTQDAQSITVTDVLNDLVVSTDDGAPDKNGVAQRSPYPNGGFISAQTVGTVPANAGAVTCSASGDKNSRSRTLTCPIDKLARGESVTIEVQIRPRVATNGTYSNTATAYSAYINDDKLTNNTSTVDLQMTALTDIAVIKQVAPVTSVALGEPATYTVSTHNYGPSAAKLVTLVDTLPANAYLVGEPWGLTGNGTCTFTDAADQPVAKGDGLRGGTMTCTWANDLQAGYEYLVQYKARSVGDDAAVGDTMDNKVHVSTATPETRDDNNNDARSITLKPAQLDVQIDMRHSADGLALGETTEYTIIVRNDSNSSSYASNVNVADLFPAAGSNATFTYEGGLNVSGTGIAATSANASMCAQPALGTTNGALDCTFPLMAPGDTIIIKFTMKADSLPLGATTGTIFHSATVKPLEVESMPGGVDVASNNATTDRTSTSKAAIDLGIDKKGPSASVNEGDTITWTLTVTNHGKAGTMSPTGGKVTDVLPAGLAFISASNGCTFDSGTRAVTCDVPSILSGATAVFTVQAKLEQPYTGSRPLVNSASVSVPGDSNPDNDNDEETTPVEPPPTVDLGINKAGPEGPLDAGDSATWTLTVTNEGKGGKPYTKGGKVTDVLPEGLDYVGASGGDGCTYEQASRTVSCDVPALDSGATAVFTIDTTLATPYKGARPLVNKASVTLTGDENPKNDESETTTTIVPPADPKSVPTLSQWGLIMLSSLLGFAAMGFGNAARRRK